MTDNMRDRIAVLLLPSANYCEQSMTRPCDDCMEYARKKADAVIRELTEAIPPIVATAIQGYAQSGLAALSHHGDASAIEELKRMNKEALHIAQYATTHEDWNGEWKRYE